MFNFHHISQKKIRLILIVILTFLLVFFLGLVKQLFGEECGPWHILVDNVNNNQSQYYQNYNWQKWDTVNGQVVDSGNSHPVAPGNFAHYDQYKLYCDKTGTGKFTSKVHIGLFPSVMNGQLPEGCEGSINRHYMSIENLEIGDHCAEVSNQCEGEKQDKIAECGSEANIDWSNWSDETCSGALCLPKVELNLGQPDQDQCQ